MISSDKFLSTLSEAESYQGVVDVEQVKIEEERAAESDESMNTDKSMEDYEL